MKTPKTPKPYVFDEASMLLDIMKKNARSGNPSCKKRTRAEKLYCR